MFGQTKPTSQSVFRSRPAMAPLVRGKRFAARHAPRALVRRGPALPRTVAVPAVRRTVAPVVRNIAAEQLAACKDEYSMYRRLAASVFSAERAINETQIERYMGDATRREYRTLQRAISNLRRFGVTQRSFAGLGQITVATNEDIETIRKKALLTGTVLGFALGATGVYLISR